MGVTGRIYLCRYCEYWNTKYCPFETEFTLSSGNPARSLDDECCLQRVALKDVSRFKERREMGQRAIKKEIQREKINTPNKRSIEF